MRILYTLNSGNPGGMEQHVLGLVTGLCARGHEVYVWCCDGVMPDLYRKAGAKVTVKNIRFDIDPFYIKSLVQFIKTTKVDVLHAHELRAVGNSLIAGRLAGIKGSITHIHTPFSEWRISAIKKKIYTTCYAFANKLFATYEIALTESRKRVKITEGLKAEKLYVIPNGIDAHSYVLSPEKKAQFKSELLLKYSVPEGRFIFGNISRTSEEKGHETVIRAFKKLLEYKEINPEVVHLLIGGGGKLEDSLFALLTELAIKDNVTITGRFPDEDRLKLYASFDAFVFPTLAEGFGIVLIEAMAVGLPIICSNLEVLEEVGGSTVFSYFETGNYINLAEKMYELYMKRDRLDILVQSAVDRVRSLYTLDRFVDEYEKLYQLVLENN